MHQLTNHIILHLNVLNVVIVNYSKMNYENNSKGHQDLVLGNEKNRMLHCSIINPGITV